jgi:MFS family permease
MDATEPTKKDVFRHPGFLSFWLAGTVSEFGTYVTTIALQVLVVLTLSGTATDVGLVNASRWLPYLLFGLIVGALVDRRKRKPILVFADLSRGILLGLIPLLWILHWLNLPVLMIFVGIFGVFSLVNDAASQSFLPRLVPRTTLLAANARIDQSSAVAQTSGPLIGGALVGLLGAPIAVLVDAASYFVSAIAIARVRVVEPAPVATGEPLHLWRAIREGLRWVYGHRILRPVAISTHTWFLFNSMLGTVFVPFVLLRLHFTAFELGITIAAAGVGGLAGSFLSVRLGTRLGVGPVVIACQTLMPLAWAIIALAPAGATTDHKWPIIALVALGQALYGLALGTSNANEMGYRQSITPDALQGRMNSTMRSINRAMIVIGAPLGGILADAIGYQPTLWIAIGGLVVVTVILAASPFRHARHGDE